MGRIIISFLIVTCFFYGCTGARNLSRNTSECTTTVSGYFSAPALYKHFAPGILFNKGFKYNLKQGRVIEYSDSGVYFVEKARLAGSLDTLFFRKELIRAVIDSNYMCSSGSLKPDEADDMEMIFYLARTDTVGYPVSKIEMISGKFFNYCIEPGIYRVVKIVQVHDIDHFFVGIPPFDLEINIIPAKTNNIGNISLVPLASVSGQSFSVPFFERLDGSAGGALGKLLADALNSDSLSGHFHFKFDLMHPVTD